MYNWAFLIIPTNRLLISQKSQVIISSASIFDGSGKNRDFGLLYPA